MTNRLAVLTPWYPSAAAPFGGAFVRSMTMAVRHLFSDITVVHLEEWPLQASGRSERRVRESLTGLLSDPRTRPASQDAGDHRVLRLPIPILRRSPYAIHAAHARDVTSSALGTLDADVVHAHVGLPAGYVAVNQARPGARIVVTEHATFLSKMLARTDGRDAYAQVLERCSSFLCVSDVLRNELLDTFPEYAEKVFVCPNVIPFEWIPQRQSSPKQLDRWLYVGSLQERKGVKNLLEAFAICRASRPRLQLTLVGDGPLKEALIRRVDSLHISDAVHFVDPVQPDAVFPVYLEHDLLVHPSTYETFGMTIVEAVATGMPVLATRCGGPEETLADLDGIAGHLVDVGEGPTELVLGFEHLEASLGTLDPTRARSELESRYGSAAVAEVLRTHYQA